jgi:hypothetical protein
VFPTIFSEDELPDGNFETIIEEGVNRRRLVVVICSRDDFDLYLGIVRAGAFDWLRDSSDTGELERILAAAALWRRALT